MTIYLTLVAPSCSNVVRDADPHLAYVGATPHSFHQKIPESWVDTHKTSVCVFFAIAPTTDRIKIFSKGRIRPTAIPLNSLILVEEVPPLLRFSPEDYDLRALVHTLKGAVLQGWHIS